MPLFLKQLNFLYKSLLITLVFSLFYSHVGLSQCLSGDCFDGYGVFKCECGYVFEGEFKDGMKVYGTLTKENLVYTGDFFKDVAHGKGEIHYADSSWYTGDFKEALMQGYGEYHFSDGAVYKGSFKADQFSGLGVLIYDGDSNNMNDFVQGQFMYDKLNGWALKKVSSETYEITKFENAIAKGIYVDLHKSEIEIGWIKNGKKQDKSVHQIPLFQNGSYTHHKKRYKIFYNHALNELQIHHQKKNGEREVVIYDFEKSFFAVLDLKKKTNQGFFLDGKIQFISITENNFIKSAVLWEIKEL